MWGWGVGGGGRSGWRDRCVGGHVYILLTARLQSFSMHVCMNVTRIQGYLFTNDIKMCPGICFGDISIIQYEQYTTSPIKNNDQQFMCTNLFHEV